MAEQARKAYAPWHPTAAGRVADPTSCSPTKPTTIVAARTLAGAETSKRGIARRRVESPQELGCHRWLIECSLAWLSRFHRLTNGRRRTTSRYAFTSIRLPAHMLLGAPEPSQIMAGASDGTVHGSSRSLL